MIFSRKDMEKYSSAVTLSDMEIFIFPELLYSLVLANIMSPIIWAWKDDPWFDGIDNMNPYRKTLRAKQFIMDNFNFNLDLETWGLTNKNKEITRFSSFLDEEIIKKSNALFGYEGDKYYFSIDIRKHFGIDKYDSNVIPYWKTETVEAMEAFKHKDDFKNGAGECVSISTLYAAVLFVICKIPLESIYLMATPLHSQNFIDIRDGLLTNNRRLVTKNMWFNGTQLSAKAQRALRNEQVTVISHNTGYIHVAYPSATIDIKAYENFKSKIKKFLITDINFDILCNFLRQEINLQECFQIKHIFNGRERFIGAEKAYKYENTSSFKVNESTLDKLLLEIDSFDFYSEPLKDRIMLNKFIEYFKIHKVDFSDKKNINKLMSEIDCPNTRKNEILDALFDFCYLEPKLPENNKEFVKTHPIHLTNSMTRQEIISYLESLRNKNTTADLAFYAYRDFSRINWDPFLKAAIERNPVSIEGSKNFSEDEVIKIIEKMPDHSIYDGSRMAQPDEVWNYNRGDGLEKAILFANIIKNRKENNKVKILIRKDLVKIFYNHKQIEWKSSKGLEGEIQF